jgi:hypothetical protein
MKQYFIFAFLMSFMIPYQSCKKNDYDSFLDSVIF